MTAIVTVTTTLLFGSAPAVGAARVQPIEVLKQHGIVELDGRMRLGQLLVVAQIALSMVLVLSAAVFLRSFAALVYRDLGFDRQRVVVAVLDARRSATPPSGRLAFSVNERLREAAAGVPGVESAAVSMATPLVNAGVRFTRDVALPGAAIESEGSHESGQSGLVPNLRHASCRWAGF